MTFLHSDFENIISRENIPVSIFSGAKEASALIAKEIATLIRKKKKSNDFCVLGLPTGSTPVEVYDELVRMHKEDGLSFENVVTFNLDEYYPIEPHKLQSYVRFMREHLLDQVDLKPENVHFPDGTIAIEEIPEFCRKYEEKVKSYGGIDLQLLGIGRTGHIGFNEPGSGKKSRTRLISLDHITIADSASDFFGEENVPKRAITMGIGNIMESKQIILMAWGEGKAKIISNTVEGPVTSNIPATFLQDHPDARIVLDEAATGELTRFKTPWLIGTCSWDDKMIKKGVIWLCQKVNKPILKLTNRDYNDNGMGNLVATKGSAYNINIRVFNQIQHTITGWPGGKPNADDSDRPERSEPFPKRVIIFSPHPDDDVISMGGTFIRLVDHGHDVHVGYQTSGNIAVFDEDVIRFSDFVQEFEDDFLKGSTASAELHKELVRSLSNKRPGQVDVANVQNIKTLIRKAEAKAACRYIGLPEDHMHFLEMPFYQTGTVKKKPLSDKDVKIVVDMMRKYEPHQIFAAGDLSDPHGTHRVCLEAVLMALDEVKKDKWMDDCYVWLYRGAWQEWDIAEVDMSVPLSPDELMRKRKAVFKHQSQKDQALFPGTDAREFWQRAEDRNRETAQLFDRLGMAEYEAIEAFVRYLP